MSGRYTAAPWRRRAFFRRQLVERESRVRSGGQEVPDSFFKVSDCPELGNDCFFDNEKVMKIRAFTKTTLVFLLAQE